jgi:hypothetical protein
MSTLIVIALLVFVIWNIGGLFAAFFLINMGIIDEEKPYCQLKLFLTSPLAWLLENSYLGPPWN